MPQYTCDMATVRETKRVMKRCQEAFAASKMTLDDVGRKMGYSGPAAKISVWQFLNKTTDPKLSMVLRFAKAVGVPISQLIDDSATQ